ncbi:type IV toxin-antitoxin system AbiEi family antitoxin domain-containing protein [Sphingomonas trueperi]|uniref:type IV toxin-antitoxin system AbiEi family antitoxin domain-containing protein n=1 Tax=Sphingomonas TaxID=13687 RepID=UPI000EB4383F
MTSFEIIHALKDRGVVSSCYLQSMGISRQHISQLRKRGILKRVRHGYYKISSFLC